MITKEKVREIAANYLKERNRNYSSLDEVDKIAFFENKEINHGIREGEVLDVYSISNGEIWGFDENSVFITIDAETGEVLYSLSSHGWVEGLEDQ